MATLLDTRDQARAAPVRLAPDAYERGLAAAAGLLLLLLAAALARGRGEWARVPGFVWAHVATVAVALALTPPLLLARRGTRGHRLAGRAWIAAMLLTALATMFVQASRPGHYSWIHLFSLWTLVAAPWAWWTARTHRVAAHRRAVRGLVTGALLVAGFFTLLPGRVMGGWLWGS